MRWGRLDMVIKPTYNTIMESFKKEGYILISKEYKNCSTKLDYQCPKGHEHSITWNGWRQGNRCVICAGLLKLTIEQVRESFEKEGYNLLTKEYNSNRSKLDYICPNGHPHTTEWFTWGPMKRRCPSCSNNIKPTIEEIKLSFEKEGYTLLSKKYINNHTKLDYTCPNDHQHSVVYASWKSGYRCPHCNKIKVVIPDIRHANVIVDGIIYKVTNIVNGKIYIGQTINTLECRKHGHEKKSRSRKNISTCFHKAIKKYSPENFKWEIIENCSSKEELDEMEFHYIKQYNSFNPNGYNMTFGGEGTIGMLCKQETKAKISASKIGKPLSDEHKQVLSNMRRGVPKNKQHVLNVAKAKSQYWSIIYPDNTNKIVKNLSEFCRDNDLSDRGMWLVANQLRSHHKGFKCKKLTHEEVCNLKIELNALILN